MARLALTLHEPMLDGQVGREDHQAEQDQQHRSAPGPRGQWRIQAPHPRSRQTTRAISHDTAQNTATAFTGIVEVAGLADQHVRQREPDPGGQAEPLRGAAWETAGAYPGCHSMTAAPASDRSMTRNPTATGTLAEQKHAREHDGPQRGEIEEQRAPA